MDGGAQYNGVENPITAAVGVVVLDADRVEFRAFCAGGGGGDGCGPAVAGSVAAVAVAVADAAGLTAAGRRSEQDPVAVLAAVRRCVDGAVAAGGWVTGAHARMMAARVLAVAVVERHSGGSVVAWDRRTGEPLCNAILWSDDGGQCRRRPRRRCGPRAPRVQPSSVPFTVQWLLDNDAGVRVANGHGVCCFGTISNWIVWNLTGGVNGGMFAADPSANALFAPLTVNRSPPDWDEKQLAVSGIYPESLPRIKSAYSLYGFVREGPLRETPVSCVLGNRQSSAVITGQSRSLATGHDNDTRPTNASKRLTASVERSTMDSAASSAVASVEIEGGLSSKVPTPAHCAPMTTPAGLSDNEPPRCVYDENSVVIEDDDDDDEEVLPTSVRIIADVAETADEPRQDDDDDDDVLGAADDVIASEGYAQPIDGKWSIGATMVAVGVGALLVFAGYKMLTRK